MWIKYFMSESRRFSKETSVYVVGEFLSKAMGFILIPLYTRYLSVEQMAFLAMVIMLWPVVMILIGQGFGSYIIRGYFEHSDKKGFVSTILPFAMISGILVAGVLHAAGPRACSLIFKEMAYKPFLQYSVYFAVFRLYFVLIHSVFQAKRQPKTVVLLTIVFFGSQLVAVLSAIFLFHASLLGILNAQLIGYVFASVVYTFQIRHEIGGRFQPALLKPSILFSLPLLPHAISAWVIGYISRIFIERTMSIEDLAVYSVAMQLTLILSIINNGLNRSWSPFVYQNYQTPDFEDLFVISARKVIVFVMLLGTLLSLFSRELLLLMGKTVYLEAESLFPILLASFLFQMLYYIHTSIIICHNKTKLLPVITISSSLISIGLNIILVSKMGMYGAALATAISYLIMSSLSKNFANKFFHYRLINWKLCVFTALILIALVCSNVFFNSLSWIGHSASGLLIMGLLIFSLERLRLFRIQDVLSLIKVKS